jgi:hypothetical protein
MERIKLIEGAPESLSRERIVGGYSFRIHATELQLAYIDRILEGSEVEPIGDGEAKPVDVICVDNVDAIENILDGATHRSNLSESLVVGDVDGGKFVYLEGVFMDILIPPTGEAPLTHISISKNPEYGAVTFIKSYLLSQYVNQHDALIFHAGSMTSNDGAFSVVLSALNHSLNSGDNAGKTTALLACCARLDAGFSFVSNDEVILSRVGPENNIIYHPFPSQIALRGKSLDAIAADGISFDLETWRGIDSITGQAVNIISPKSYRDRGFDISKLNLENLNWCFIEMNHGITDYSILPCEEERARELFVGAIFEGRMGQALGPLYFGETRLSGAFDLGRHRDKLDKMFGALVSRGIRFYIVRSGTDRSRINKMFSQIAE